MAFAGAARRGLRPCLRARTGNGTGVHYRSAAAATALRRPQSTMAKAMDEEDFVAETVDICQEFANKPQTGLSLKQLLQAGLGVRQDQRAAHEETLLQVAKFIHGELPTRIARRVVDLGSIPELRDTESVRYVHRLYAKTFREVLEAPAPDTPEKEASFAAKLQELFDRHTRTPYRMACGAYELKQRLGDNGGEDITETHAHVDSFLTDLHTSRIGLRVLSGQYLALRQSQEDAARRIGLIDLETSPADVAAAAIGDATQICEHAYGVAPAVTVRGCLDRTFAYLPEHLHRMLVELLVNSMRATCEARGGGDGGLPDVKVIIADGASNEDVGIKVSDEGGGMNRRDQERSFSYLFTTADAAVQARVIAEGASGEGPVAGLGYGLPLTRAYARYFGGDMQLISMEGHGTHAWLHLSRVGDASEPLP
uniref:Protein-serine/threonine kinase n=1 Tax=Phaeomonas parva TaxID=124430 RepID=A0A6U4D7U4_9STRA|mmetsp:Transcript_15819/g.48231  ORF Transcript_15819/g.48231 Transcript_15819/m.48231 type:complete len:425 (+) Transcript_15819:290-1564(+)